MFIPQNIQDNLSLVLQLLNITCGREEVISSDANFSEGYLLLVRCEGTCPNWDGPVVKVAPTAETTIALSHIEVLHFFTLLK